MRMTLMASHARQAENELDETARVSKSRHQHLKLLHGELAQANNVTWQVLSPQSPIFLYMTAICIYTAHACVADSWRSIHV